MDRGEEQRGGTGECVGERVGERSDWPSVGRKRAGACVECARRRTACTAHGAPRAASGAARNANALCVVVGRDHAEVERAHVDVVDLYTAGFGEVVQRVFDELRQVVRHVLRRDADEVVVPGVLVDASVVKRPRQVVDGVLLVFDRFDDDLRVHVVRETVVEVRLHRKWLVEKLLVVGLSRVLAEDDADAALPVRAALRPARAADHLENVGDRAVDVLRLPRVVPLPAH